MEGLIIGGNFAFQNRLELTIKTASTNSPWAYIREGLLLEGYLCLRFEGLIFGRAYFWGGLLSEFYDMLFLVMMSVYRVNYLCGIYDSLLQVAFLMVFRVWMLGGHLPYFTKQDNPASFADSLATRIMTYWYLIAFNCWLLLSPSVLSYDWQMGSIPLVESSHDPRNLATLVFIVIAGFLAYSAVLSSNTDVSIVTRLLMYYLINNY